MADNSNKTNGIGNTDDCPKKTAKVKHDWYQTETHIVITILVKNTEQDGVAVRFQDDSISVKAQLPDEAVYDLNLDLAYPIVPDQSAYRVIPSKIEIKLKKRNGIRWTALEREMSDTASAQPMSEAVQNAGPPKYPSSASKARDWDRVIGDITKEESDEKPEGETALNALFQKIYSQGSDEVKRAMNKSFQESGGTVLSTNWNEVAKEKVEVKAPDGMEWHTWEQ